MREGLSGSCFFPKEWKIALSGKGCGFNTKDKCLPYYLVGMLVRIKWLSLSKCVWHPPPAKKMLSSHQLSFHSNCKFLMEVGLIFALHCIPRVNATVGA